MLFVMAQPPPKSTNLLADGETLAKAPSVLVRKREKVASFLTRDMGAR
jgi:hypothetical protein